MNPLSEPKNQCKKELHSTREFKSRNFERMIDCNNTSFRAIVCGNIFTLLFSKLVR